MESKDTLYNLRNKQIDQLHNATLNISKQCFEIKKLCLTIEVTTLTFTLNITSNIDDCYLYIAFLGLIIPLIFWILDSLTYYYQDKLRYRMLKTENEIRNEYGLSMIENKHDRSTFLRLYHSAINLSQTLYCILGIIDLIFIYIFLV